MKRGPLEVKIAMLNAPPEHSVMAAHAFLAKPEDIKIKINNTNAKHVRLESTLKLPGYSPKPIAKSVPKVDTGTKRVKHPWPKAVKPVPLAVLVQKLEQKNGRRTRGGEA